MDSISEVLHDTLIYTLPFVVGKLLLHPLSSINYKLQGQYQKIQDETESKAVYIKHHSFSLREKAKCGKEIVEVSGVKGLFTKLDHELIPSCSARLVEGLLFFGLMKFCTDILHIRDSLFLLTGLVLFVVCLVGAFCQKVSHDILSTGSKDTTTLLKQIMSIDKGFWNQYEIEFGAYYVYGLIQVYFEILTFYYLEPGLGFQMVLFASSRILAAFMTRPLEIMAQWAPEYDFDYDKLFSHIIKKDGKLALFAGTKEMVYMETLLSIIMCIGFRFL